MEGGRPGRAFEHGSNPSNRLAVFETDRIGLAGVLGGDVGGAAGGPVTLRPGAFLDRDGVLNAVTVVDGIPHPPHRVDGLRLLDGVTAACQTLADAGAALIVVTNQPDIGRGSTSLADVEELNEKLRTLLPLDDVLVCPHDDIDACECRKPKPGLLFAGARRHGIDLTRSVMVGDRWRDIDAGRAAGVRTVLIGNDYRERPATGQDLTVSRLQDAVPWILERLQLKESPPCPSM